MNLQPKDFTFLASSRLTTGIHALIGLAIALPMFMLLFIFVTDQFQDLDF